MWELVISISGKPNKLEHIEMPKNFIGVNGRNSDNELIEKVLNWKPKYSLRQRFRKDIRLDKITL